MSSLAERLRIETRLQHEQTEQLLYSEALRTGMLAPAQYGHLLLMHRAFHAALEKAIDHQSVFFAGYEPDTRRKTPWLLADLTYLQLNLPVLPDLFTDWSPVALLGAAYVGEGSMLGGKTVWHYLNQSPALQPVLEQARFYRGYGPETGSRWRTFSEFLVQNQTEVNTDDIVAGAKQAFLAYQYLFGETRTAVSGLEKPVKTP